MSFPTSSFDISCDILISKSKDWAANELAKQQKMINYHIKGLYIKQPVIKKSNFSQFFFSQKLLHECLFYFFIKAFANFEKVKHFIGKLSLYVKMEKI